MTRTILAAMLFACPAAVPPQAQTYYVQCRQEYEVTSVHCVSDIESLPECEWINLYAVGLEHCEDLASAWDA